MCPEWRGSLIYPSSVEFPDVVSSAATPSYPKIAFMIRRAKAGRCAIPIRCLKSSIVTCSQYLLLGPKVAFCDLPSRSQRA